MRVHEPAWRWPPMLPVYTSEGIPDSEYAWWEPVAWQQLPMLWDWLGDRAARLPLPVMTLELTWERITLAWLGRQTEGRPGLYQARTGGFALELSLRSQEIELSWFDAGKAVMRRHEVPLTDFDAYIPDLVPYPAGAGRSMPHPVFSSWWLWRWAGWNAHGHWEVRS